MARLTIPPDGAGVAAAAAERITSLIEGTAARRGRVGFVLAGGRTPEPMYRLLAANDQPWRGRIDWSRLHLFWTDERSVGPDHPDSNFGLANRALIRYVPIPPSQVHRIRGELSAIDAAREYQETLQRDPVMGSGSLFDVTLLGIGADAHIASIFPASPLVRSDPPFRPPSPATAGTPEALAAGIWVPTLHQWRITLTPRAILASGAIIVIAQGATKAPAIAAAIEMEADSARYPAQLLREAGDRVDWIIDGAAAARLHVGPHE